MESALQDLRFALRQLRQNPGFAGTAILVLGLGLASSVAIFAFVDAALLQPLPYKDPSRLVAVYRQSSNCSYCDLSYPDYLDWKKDNSAFRSLEAWGFTVYLWKSPEGVKDLRAARVSGGFFRTLGVTPVLGRGFTDEDDTPAAPRTVLLPYRTWQSRFGGRKDVVGQSIILDDAAYTVIGVLPREFHFALRAAEFWTTIHDANSCEQKRGCHSTYAIARLKDDVSVASAQANAKAIAANLEKQYPDSNKGQSAQVMPLSQAVVGEVRPTLLLLLSGAALLLLIACVNVASLLLVRAEGRRREMALRGALGASQGRLVRLFAAEGMVLAAMAVGLGLVVAYEAIPWLFQLIPERLLRGMPYFRDAGLHPRTLLFAAAASLLAVVLFSVTPVLRLSAGNLRDQLAEGGRGSAGTTWKRFGSNLVAVELAIAMILMAAAGLLSKSLYRLLHVELNFNPEHVATMEIDTPYSGRSEEQRRIVLFKRIVERISSLPGGMSAAHTSELPVTCNCSKENIRVPGHPWNGVHQEALQREVSTDYFSVLQARRIEGRFFTAADDGSKAPVAIINRALARQFFGREDPVGRMVGDEDLSPGSLRQIVGVVDDIREAGLNETLEPALYSPFNQNADHVAFLTVRTGQDPEAMIAALAAAIREVDPDVGVRNEFTMTQHIANLPVAFLNRSSAWLVGAFAGLSLLLGVIGLYGVIAYSVGRRTREIGVRMALGAQPAAVYRLILGEASLVTSAGIAIGIGCSIATAALLRDFLFGVEAWDIPTLLAVAVVLGICALLASYFPARKAASVNPVEALRAE